MQLFVFCLSHPNFQPIKLSIFLSLEPQRDADTSENNVITAIIPVALKLYIDWVLWFVVYAHIIILCDAMWWCYSNNFEWHSLWVHFLVIEFDYRITMSHTLLSIWNSLNIYCTFFCAVFLWKFVDSNIARI